MFVEFNIMNFGDGSSTDRVLIVLFFAKIRLGAIF